LGRKRIPGNETFVNNQLVAEHRGLPNEAFSQGGTVKRPRRIVAMAIPTHQKKGGVPMSLPFSAADPSGWHSIGRDLAHAARSLAKERGFTLACVISLGIGMVGLVALATFTRMITASARVIDTNGLIELLVLPLGPLRAKAGEWALEQWSYPDYQALQDTDIGMAMLLGVAAPRGDSGAPACEFQIDRVPACAPYTARPVGQEIPTAEL
jgi:hypothetical protein